MNGPALRSGIRKPWSALANARYAVDSYLTMHKHTCMQSAIVNLRTGVVVAFRTGASEWSSVSSKLVRTKQIIESDIYAVYSSARLHICSNR